MNRWLDKLVFWACISLAFFIPSGAAARPGGKGAQAATAVSTAAPASEGKKAADDSSEYVGAEVCMSCHEDMYKSWEKSPHWRTTLDTKGGPSHQGCEGCHGPGAAHVAGGGDVTKIFVFGKHSAKEINERCLTCHASGPTQIHASNSFHRLNEVSCTDCHSPHHPATSENLLVKKQPELCYSCHLQQKAQFSMPFRHRVNEGLIQCTDCHDQHGSAGSWESSTGTIRQLRTSDSGNFVCYKCHKDKQGPFVFEHAAVRIEGCAACHIPHGGANPHMLKYNNVDLQCLQCHTAAHFGPTPTTGFPVMTAQNSDQQQACTLCHVTVHGSNFNAFFFR